MKQAVSKKKRALIACSALLAVALAGGVGGMAYNNAHADGDDTTPSTPKILYYVDAGNMVTEEGGTTKSPGRDFEGNSKDGFPSSVKSVFMDTYHLEFGTKTTTGLYNSTLDNQYGVDPKTDKSWGFYTDAGSYSWNRWRYAKTESTATPCDGYQTSRHINESGSHEGILTYKFEVDNDTDALKITIGTRTYNKSWASQTYPISINGVSKGDIEAKKDADSEYTFTQIVDKDNNPIDITGKKEGTGENAKSYVTLDFGTSATTASAYVSWIMVTTADYELPITYTMSTSIVKADATTVKLTPSDGSGDVDATLTPESQAKILEAAPLSEVNVTATLADETEITGKVTVIPTSTKCFVNVGSTNTYDGVMNADGAYNSTNGYGYLEEGNVPHSGKQFPGSCQWVNDPFNISCRADMDTIVYQFDLADGKVYEVIVGIVEHWAQYPIDGGRKAEISVNGGAGTLLTLPVENDASVHGSVYGNPANGKLNVKIETKCSEATVIAYILVYDHTHGTMTETPAVASTCNEHGNIEYWTCSVCGQKYNDENATTLITNTEAPLSETHTPGTHHEAGTSTCAVAGTKEYWDCSVCGGHFSDANCTHANKITDLDEWKLPLSETHTTDEEHHHEAGTSTCAVAGTKEYWDCSVCGGHFSDANCTHANKITDLDTWKLPLAEHTTDEQHYTEAVAATCTTAGNSEYWTCSVCEKLFSDEDCEHEIDAIPTTNALGHNYGDLIAKVDPSGCTTPGTVAHYHCDRCNKDFDADHNELESIAIEAIGHKYNAITWEEWTDDFKCTYSGTCSVCGDIQNTTQAVITSAVTKAATCTEAGVKTYTAKTGTGENAATNPKTKTQAISALGHAAVAHDAVAATCTTTGTAAYWTCSREGCDKLFSDADCTNEITEVVVTNKIAHTTTKTEAVAATCTETGTAAYWTCSVCEKMFSDEACEHEITEVVVTNKIAHTTTKTDEVAATCAATGTEAYWTCSVCDKMFSDEACEHEITEAVVIDKVAHDYDWTNITWDWANKTATVACKYDSTHTDSMTATVTEEVTKQATCSAAGEKTLTATVGKKYTTTKTEVIPATGHKAVAHDAVAATCDKAGAAAYWTCSECDKKFSDAACTTEIEAVVVIAAKGHDYDYSKLVWTWTGVTAAKAKASCKNDATHTVDYTATITSEVTKEATKDEEGETTYTATITVDGKTYTATKTEPIAKVESSGGCKGAISSTAGLIGISVISLGAVCAVVFIRKKKTDK